MSDLQVCPLSSLWKTVRDMQNMIFFKLNFIFIKASVPVDFSVLNFSSVSSNGDFVVSAVTAF